MRPMEHPDMPQSVLVVTLSVERTGTWALNALQRAAPVLKFIPLPEQWVRHIFRWAVRQQRIHICDGDARLNEQRIDMLDDGELVLVPTVPDSLEGLDA